MKYVDTRNQLADMLTKGSFTRDELDHLLRLLKIMNFSMFSCSHISFSRTKKQSAMSKRGHESTSKEGQWIWCQETSWVRGCIVLFNTPGIRNWNTVVFHPAAGNWRKTRTKIQRCILKRLNRMILNLPAPGKLGRRDEPSDSASARRLERGEDPQMGRSKMEFHNTQISNYRYFEKVFNNLQKKLDPTEDFHKIVLKHWRPTYWYGDCLCRQRWKQPSILDRITLKIWKYTGTRISRKFRIYSISRRDWYWTTKMKFWMWPLIEWTAPSWARSTLAHDQVITWSEARVRVYSDSVLCLVVTPFRSKSKIGKSSRRISTVQFFQRTIWNWWRTDWARVE